MPDLVIETQSLTKRYGKVVAVDSLSLQVTQGGVFGLLGPNGSGKTTTMGMLLGLVLPTSGSIRVFGEDISGRQRQVLRRIGAVVETPAFYPYLSGWENLRYFQGLSRRGAEREVDRLLEEVGLAGREGSKFSTYSMGMKQRLGIAYALLGNPELVFLDEPTNGLDPAGMAEVRDLIRDLGASRTVLLSSHLLNEVEHVCDHVAILSKGKLISQGRVQDLLRQRGVVQLKTTNDQRAMEVLAALDWTGHVQAENGGITVAAAPERSWELTAALAEHQVYVSEMHPVQVSLERYFLDVTGDALEPSSEGARQ